MAGGLGKYLANQIHQGKLDKEQVFNTYPTLQHEINQYLEDWNTIPTIIEEPEE